jgi:hypothetical protein
MAEIGQVETTAPISSRTAFPLEPFKWRPGQSGNPAGRPKGSAHKLAEDFKADLLAEWKRRGPAVLKALKPHQLARLALDALPRELLLSVEHTASPFDGMSAEELQQTLADIRAFRAAANAKTIDAKPE